jgi:chemotaxis protein CheD
VVSGAVSYSKTEVDGKVVVGVGDLAVSNNPAALVVTYALGSCIGVTIYDPVAKVGGLLHFMLPSAELNQDKAQANPAMFGDSGIPMLFRACYDLGAKKERLIVCAAGGAEVLADEGHFKIGSRNRTLLRKIFWKNSILLAADETGGSSSRTLSLSMTDGTVTVRTQGSERLLWPT